MLRGLVAEFLDGLLRSLPRIIPVWKSPVPRSHSSFGVSFCKALEGWKTRYGIRANHEVGRSDQCGEATAERLRRLIDAIGPDPAVPASILRGRGGCCASVEPA